MIMEQELPLLVVATRNAHKTGEIRAMLAGKWEVKDRSFRLSPGSARG